MCIAVFSIGQKLKNKLSCNYIFSPSFLFQFFLTLQFFQNVNVNAKNKKNASIMKQLTNLLHL